MTADTLGGVWTYALALSHGLAARGVQVELATLGRRPTTAQRAEAAAVPGLRLHASEYRLIWMRDPWEDLRRSRQWLLGLARGLQPDLIHLNDFGYGDLPWQAPALAVGHSCVLSWWEAVHGVPAPAADWARYGASVRRSLQAVDAVVAPTQALLDALGRHYGPLPRPRVIANGLPPAPPPAPALKLPLILSAGRLWDEAKNIAALAEVAPGLPWPVVVAGESAHPDGAERSLSNVHLLGQLSAADLAQCYGWASLFVLPARYEPFGLCPLEAALRGCVLVLGDIPSLREVWGDAALYVPTEAPQRLRQVLEGLIGDAEARAAWAERAYRRARTLTAERMAAAYLRTYAELRLHRRPTQRAAGQLTT